MATSYKLGNILTLDGRKGKIVNVYKPIGTYPIFTVHFYDDGTFKNFAAHELAKAGSSPDVTSHIEQPDEMSDFSDMFDNWDYTEDEQTVPGPNQSIMSETVHPEVPEQSKKVDNSRFQQTDDIDVQNFVLQHENVNTKRKTESHIKLLYDYLQSCGEVRECHEIPPSELDKYLSRFLLSVRQRDGQDYEPTTLRGMFGSVERYLRRKTYSASLVTGPEFFHTREALKSKQKNLKQLGKGNKPKAADPITDNDIV